MKLGIKIAGRQRQVEINRRGEQIEFKLNGKPFSASVAEVSPGIYSVLLAGAACEVRIERRAGELLACFADAELPVEIIDPRQWKRERGGALGAEGRQQIVAPMPGKVVRMLVAAGEAVEAGQGLIVVEAMKMQNEVKSPKAGKIERLMVREGLVVTAGEPLVVIV